MERIISIFRRNWTYFVGAIAGGITGYLYWHFIGCESGTCPITASPLRSILWGAVIGSLLFSLFKKDTKNEQDNK